MNQLPWAVCSRAEGSTMHSVNVRGMNNEPFPETFPVSVSAFSFLSEQCDPFSSDHGKVQSRH